MKYIPLNIKTNYELLSSLIKIDDIILYAKKNNINALGITDSNMFSCMEFYTKCSKNNIKPIIGIEIFDIYIYAKNYNGYVGLCKIVSEKNINDIDISFIKNYSKDLIIVCDYNSYNKYNDMFDLVYIFYDNENDKKNALLLSENVIYLPKINYFNKEDSIYYKYLMYIKEEKTIDEDIVFSENYLVENDNEFDINTTIKFSNMIDIIFPKVELHIPKYREKSLEFLVALSNKGLMKRLSNKVSDVYKKRLDYELSVISKMGFVDYFLIVYDFVLFAKKNNIMVGPGRGSAAGSLVSFCLGITEMDPVKYELIFERFLNPERITMPDIDIDFDNTRREEVINYVKNKYGSDKVAKIITFNTMLPKQAIRDVGRVLKTDDTIISRICKTINDEKTFDDLKNNKDFMMIIKKNDEINKIIDISNKLCGVKKHTSVHAAGVVISDESLDSIMPLYKNDSDILTGYEGTYIESLGLLKMDFLSIANLNTIFNVVNNINKDKYILNINKLDFNDKLTLDLFKKCNTNGIFQYETDLMKRILKLINVTSFNDLIDAVALKLPGPREMINEYSLRKNGKKKVTYLIKELEPILKSTYGIMIYQEQVLETLRVIGGYSYSEADLIRRAMSKKKVEIINETKPKFISNVIKKGYSESIALELFNLIDKFSNYGFNKSHSVVYSVVGFQMAYLKAHYPLYFMTYLLNMNKSSDKIKTYIDEAKTLEIEFTKININDSDKLFIISNNKIVLPFTIIKNISTNVSDEIINERNKGKFISFYDFMIRCYNKSINKRVVISLIECGVFDVFNLNKNKTINNFEVILNYVSLCKEIDSSLVEMPLLEEYDDYSDSENIDHEIEYYGFYLSHHPVTKIDRSNSIKLDVINKYYNKTVETVLLVDSIKNIVTRNNEKMCFVKLSDEFKSIDGVIFPKVYNRINIEKGIIYKFNVTVEKRENNIQLIVNNIIFV